MIEVLSVFLIITLHCIPNFQRLKRDRDRETERDRERQRQRETERTEQNRTFI